VTVELTITPERHAVPAMPVAYGPEGVSVPGVEEPYDQHVGRYGAQLAADAYRRLGSPDGSFQLTAPAWSARGTAL